MLEQQVTAIAIALAVIVGLEVWRRSLRQRAPRWVHAVTIVLLVIVAGGVAFTQWELRRSLEAIAEEDASNKATALATGISRAMIGNALAVLSVVLAAIVLGVGTYLARRVPHPGSVPVAKTRRVAR